MHLKLDPDPDYCGSCSIYEVHDSQIKGHDLTDSFMQIKIPD